MAFVTPGSGTMNGESLWPRLAELSLVIEGCEYDRLHAVLADEFERITTHVRLVGAGADGLGEDISVFKEDGTTLHETQPALPLEGEWTLAGFCELYRSAQGCSRKRVSSDAVSAGRSSARKWPQSSACPCTSSACWRQIERTS
jgi:hypothetical protein